eukprot:COSAG02_NODE_30_length_50867_cov_66.594331_45_plen_81_part_00
MLSHKERQKKICTTTLALISVSKTRNNTIILCALALMHCLLHCAVVTMLLYVSRTHQSCCAVVDSLKRVIQRPVDPELGD